MNFLRQNAKGTTGARGSILSSPLSTTKRNLVTAGLQSAVQRVFAESPQHQRVAAAAASSLVCAAPSDAIDNNAYLSISSCYENEQVSDGASIEYDILGLAQSMLDASVSCVPDDLLMKLNVEKGGRR
jgi:hypothetical protein